jgi:hypothetical protein
VESNVQAKDYEARSKFQVGEIQGPTTAITVRYVERVVWMDCIEYSVDESAVKSKKQNAERRTKTPRRRTNSETQRGKDEGYNQTGNLNIRLPYLDMVPSSLTRLAK